jgi:hypothetical protein
VEGPGGRHLTRAADGRDREEERQSAGVRTDPDGQRLGERDPHREKVGIAGDPHARLAACQHLEIDERPGPSEFQVTRISPKRGGCRPGRRTRSAPPRSIRTAASRREPSRSGSTRAARSVANRTAGSPRRRGGRGRSTQPSPGRPPS